MNPIQTPQQGYQVFGEGLLLGQLEVQTTGDEGDEKRVLGDALSLRGDGDLVGKGLRETDEFVGAHGADDSTCASGSVLVSALSTETRPAVSHHPAALVKGVSP